MAGKEETEKAIKASAKGTATPEQERIADRAAKNSRFGDPLAQAAQDRFK